MNGDAPFDADLAFPVPPDKIGEFVTAYNANLPVNAIPYVCAAAPGILAPEDLPPSSPVGHSRGSHSRRFPPTSPV